MSVLRGCLAILLALPGLLPVTMPAAASDLAREKRLAEQIVDGIFDGEPFYLEADGHAFLSIYMEAAEGPAEQAVLILHGRGYHPDWEQVVQPLRVGLTDHGWNTLSIQLPVLAKDAKYYDYIPTFPAALPRIDAALEYLKAQGNTRVVMIAHSCAVHMSMAWVREHGSAGIDGYVGIGMGATDYQQPMPEPFPFERIDVPVLDLYGGLDYPAVQRGAPARWAAISERSKGHSRQVIMPDADHYMSEQNGELVSAVAGWLEDTFGMP